MFLTFKYRLLPTKAQHAALASILEDQRQLYNAALEERIGCYRKTGRGREYMDQCHSVVEWRKSDPSAAECPANIQRWTLKRIEGAYAAFFRRMKGGDAPGYPRFKGCARWNSFGFAEFCGIRWDGKRLRFRTMPGALRVHLHRPLPAPVNIRFCVFRRDDKGWTVSFRVRAAGPEAVAVVNQVGIDAGLKVLAHLSDGVVIPNPRIARAAEKDMRRRQRALSRCQPRSNRRRKVRREVTRLNAKIADTRKTYLHQQSAMVVKTYDLVAVEDLNIANMKRHPTMARSIHDASWGAFYQMIAYKAERAGKTFVKVPAKNTTQRCSGCGVLVPKSLAVRTHSCPECGLVIDRDWNASLNILQAVAGLDRLKTAHEGISADRNIKRKPQMIGHLP